MTNSVKIQKTLCHWSVILFEERSNINKKPAVSSNQSHSWSSARAEHVNSDSLTNPTFEVGQSFLPLLFPCQFDIKVQSLPALFSMSFSSSRELAGQTQTQTLTLRVIEAAYKNHTTLNCLRETDALETIPKMLSMRLFKWDKSIRALITVSNDS